MAAAKKQCRYVVKFRGFLAPHLPYCACKSPRNNLSREPRGVTDDGYPIMGCFDGLYYDGWYKLCVLGKDDGGVTPSRCKYYK